MDTINTKIIKLSSNTNITYSPFCIRDVHGDDKSKRNDQNSL